MHPRYISMGVCVRWIFSCSPSSCCNRWAWSKITHTHIAVRIDIEGWTIVVICECVTTERIWSTPPLPLEQHVKFSLPLKIICPPIQYSVQVCSFLKRQKPMQILRKKKIIIITYMHINPARRFLWRAFGFRLHQALKEKHLIRMFFHSCCFNFDAFDI